MDGAKCNVWDITGSSSSVTRFSVMFLHCLCQESLEVAMVSLSIQGVFMQNRSLVESVPV